MHYSWIEPLLAQFPSRLHSALAAVLTEEQTTGLKIVPASVGPMAKSFLLAKLSPLLNIEERLPLDYLPQTPFFALAGWSKRQLTHAIDLLGIYDLASEVRRIVDPAHLKNIYACLPPKQLHYLKICLHRKESLVSPKLGLDLAHLDCAGLRHAIHRRGLVRLGRGLSGEHPDFIWHLAHRLDRGRGSLLLGEHRTAPSPAIASLLQQQLLNVIHFLEER